MKVFREASIQASLISKNNRIVDFIIQMRKGKRITLGPEKY